MLDEDDERLSGNEDSDEPSLDTSAVSFSM